MINIYRTSSGRRTDTPSGSQTDSPTSVMLRSHVNGSEGTDLDDSRCLGEIELSYFKENKTWVHFDLFKSGI